MLPPCRVRAWRTLPMAPTLSTDLTRVFRGTVVLSITRAVTREPVAIFVIRKTPVRPLKESVHSFGQLKKTSKHASSLNCSLIKQMRWKAPGVLLMTENAVNVCPIAKRVMTYR